jgi:hypothetical protein
MGQGTTTYETVTRIIRDAFFEPTCSRSDRYRSFLISSAACHGIISSGLPTASIQHELLRHVFLGQCFMTSGSHCVIVSAHHREDVKAFIVFMLDVALASELTSDQSTIICSSLGLNDLQLANMHSDADRLHFLRLYREGFLEYRDLHLAIMSLHNLKLRELRLHCSMHNISALAMTAQCLRDRLLCHFVSEGCELDCGNAIPMCKLAVSEPIADLQMRLILAALSERSTKLNRTAAKQLLLSLGVSFDPSLSLGQMRVCLRSHASILRKGKQSKQSLARALRTKQLGDIHANWPALIPSSRKEQLLSDWRQMTQSLACMPTVCAVCGEDKEPKLMVPTAIPFDSINLNLLRAPYPCPELDPFPADDPLHGVMLEPAGVSVSENNETGLRMCKPCHREICNGKLPASAMANDLYVGPVPPELADLTFIEEALIARRQAKCTIIHLKEDQGRERGQRKKDGRMKSGPRIAPNLGTTQRGLSGNVIVFPQNPSDLGRYLPRSLEDTITPICVVFVGTEPPDRDWLLEHATPLIVRRERVRSALIWLRSHNPLYADVIIRDDHIDALPEHDLAPVHIETEAPSAGEAAQGARFDASGAHDDDDIASILKNVVVTDLDMNNVSSNQISAAAMRHLRNGGDCLQMRHGSNPSNQYEDEHLFPLLYPTLFPYGVGGFVKERRSKISMEKMARHYFSLHDSRFQMHRSFLFIVFNMLQRQAVSLHAKLKTSASSFSAVADELLSVSDAAIQAVLDRMESGDHSMGMDPEQRAVRKLMDKVSLVSSKVKGTSASRVSMRNEIRGMMFDLGLPSFYLTINPADVYNPIVSVLAGADFDLDAMTASDVSTWKNQASLVAGNPFIVARFFRNYIEAFLSTILAYDPAQKSVHPGILGLVKGYYGCVEAQGRGTLHCHMLIWIDGAKDPQEIRDRVIRDGDTDFRDRLLAFLDDTILTHVPLPPPVETDVNCLSDSHHPCAVRMHRDSTDAEIAKDLSSLVGKCQVHSHSDSCFIYWKGYPDPKECRFELDPDHHHPKTSMDMETGELQMRVTDGMVNNFCETIMRAVRCNMDIKFIGSGVSAKAILYYITDYITKPQLKMHASYATLQSAVRKLESMQQNDADPVAQRAKLLLVKCANSLLGQQELSGQQVASYLLGHDDSFKSHSFRSLFWTSFVGYIDKSFATDDPKPGGSVESTLDMIAGDTTEEHPADLREDEVLISSSSDGATIFAQGSQLTDYKHRPQSEPFDLNVWDFVALVDKQTKRVSNGDAQLPQEFGNLSLAKVLLSDSDSCSAENSDHDSRSPGNKSKGNRRGRPPNALGPLSHPHPQAKSHNLHLRSKRLVPVPIGPSLPRRDVEPKYEHYCKVMLTLFKPWRDASDLRLPEQSWAAAFQDFVPHLSTHHLHIIDNMQRLHECKDSRDEHYANRHIRIRGDAAGGLSDQPQSWNAPDPENDDDIVAELQLLSQIEQTQTKLSKKETNVQRDVADAVASLEGAGFYHTNPSQSALQLINWDAPIRVSATERALEAKWRDAYKQRRESAKLALRTHASAPQTSELYNLTDHDSNNCGSLTVSTYSGQSDSRDAGVSISEHAFRPIVPSVNATESVIRDVIRGFTLNEEQSLAFRTVAEHSNLPKSEPLRMYLGGEGGTGKSRVIEALSNFFNIQKESRRFRLTSYTGVAAANIGGMTLHAALSLANIESIRSGANGSESRKALLDAWTGVDYLFVDEVSMISCELLKDIDYALVIAKASNYPFGNISIIFAGDFCQLAPVAGTRLFAAERRLSGIPGDGLKISGQKKLEGRLLWLTVSTVVFLTVPMRQAGPANRRFCELLHRARFGICTRDDIAILTTRIISSSYFNFQIAPWRNAVVITRKNAVKDELNRRAVHRLAGDTDREVLHYYARDFKSKKQIKSSALEELLLNLDTGQSPGQMGRLPLVEGMPVVIHDNFDVQGGVVNGTEGILKTVLYEEDAETGRRYATSCVVIAQSSTCENLPSLGPKEVVVHQKTHSITFVEPFTKKKHTIQRYQLPILPAYAMTDYKAQGRTMSNVIIDLQSCPSRESAYVMLSRATSLNSLAILRPFKSDILTRHASEEYRNEARRLQLKAYETILRAPSEAHRHEQVERAIQELNREMASTKDAAEGRDLQAARSEKRSAARSAIRTRQQNIDTTAFFR